MHVLDQYLSSFSVHRNHFENHVKMQILDSVGLVWDIKLCIYIKLLGDANVGGPYVK